MPRVRIEWIPVQIYGLGHLGFDHLQLVFEPGAATQNEWFVMEGVREATSDGTFLGIEGADGRTTSAIANLASRAELANKIGTPEHRRQPPAALRRRCIRRLGDDVELCAGHRSGGLPVHRGRAARLAPADNKLVFDDRIARPLLRARSHAGSSLWPAHIAGNGDAARHQRRRPTTHRAWFYDPARRTRSDSFEGGATAQQTEKFYGGEGDDIFRWSPGFNIVQGVRHSSNMDPTAPTPSTIRVPAR